MRLPFTHGEFLDLFGDYNRALWPVGVLLWLATVIACWKLYRRRPNASRALAAVLGLQWAWAGAVYHLLLFRRINPVAVVFGAAFLVQAALLLWRGAIRTALTFDVTPSAWHGIGLALLFYAGLYPVLGLVFGLQYPRLPTFGVPCPTTILTGGALLLAPRREARFLAGIPVLWAAVGGSAAFVLGIRADLGLVASGILLLGYLIWPAPSVRSSMAPGMRFGPSRA